MNAVKNEKGFTIIEVVLVLAIAGLIFLMVFIALPALQRGQRDTQRRTDVGTIVSQLNSYATNNKGQLPENAGNPSPFATFLTTYVHKGDGLKDPKTGDNYTSQVDSATAIGGANAYGIVQYQRGFQCNGENMASGGGNRQAAVRIKLEGSGYFCQNVQN